MILEDGGNNIYEFCNNNSVRYFDSNGELVQLTIPVGVAIAAVAEKIMEAAIGAMIAYVASEIATEVVTQAQEKQCKPPKKCAPCDPPVGTIMYKVDTDHSHAGMRPHVHYYRVSQSPPSAGCRCWGKRDANPVGRGSVPQAGALPYRYPTGGGVL